MRRLLLLLIVFSCAPALHAEDLADICHASSSYDLTLAGDGLLFDRPQPAPERVEWRNGHLFTDGTALPLGAESVDRLSLFDRQLRALLPRVRALADDGVELAARAVREQAVELRLAPASLAELDRRLAAQVDQLRQRIARSRSTHDWHGEAADRYLQDLVGQVLPPVMQDLGSQALDAAMRGDLQEAARLRDEAAGLQDAFRARLTHRLQALQPRVAALCPALRRLAQLQQDVPIGGGRTLDLLQVP